MKDLIQKIKEQKQTIWALSKNQIKSRFAGTVGGLFWAVAQPLALITIYYFVFAIGFKAQGPTGTTFVVWFICGLVPWFFFAETLQSITTSVVSHNYLVKKTIFPIETLPFVSIVSGTIVHIIFAFILFLILVFHEIPLLSSRILVLYYFACTCFFMLGLGWILSSLQVYYRDIGHGLGIFLNLLFWSTPIVWSKEMIPERFHFIIDINPITYFIDGYRNSLVYETVILPEFNQSLYFWVFTLLLLFVGKTTFDNLKPYFPDVI